MNPVFDKAYAPPRFSVVLPILPLEIINEAYATTLSLESVLEFKF
jgi:hypothetical protein